MKIYCSRNLSDLDRYAGKDCWVLVFDKHNYNWLFIKVLDPNELRSYYQNNDSSYDVRNIDHLIEDGYICVKAISIFNYNKDIILKLLNENDFYNWNAMRRKNLKLVEPHEFYSTAELLEDLDIITKYIVDNYKNYTP